ncbi:MAG TPA: hypothetical protein PLP33_25880 [Leptospiraceae bacterium]|nr:hypothetical protein [Leptospiraceae bacterium]
MTLEEFIESTKDVPKSTIIWVLADGCWREIGSIEVRKEKFIYARGVDSPMPEGIELRIKPLS